MKLLTEEVKERLPELYTVEGEDDPEVQVKFFLPGTNLTWYCLEFDGDDTFFGVVVGHEVEAGYFSLNELRNLKTELGFTVERDLYLQPKPITETYLEINQMRGNPDGAVPGHLPWGKSDVDNEEYLDGTFPDKEVKNEST